jgi:pimeloyl-ACP methyl ester carboxylesterase
MTSIPFHAFGSPQNPALHFLHANGYPAPAYEPLLELLSQQFHVLAMDMRPLWPGADPLSIQDWRPLAEDLSRFLDERGLYYGVVGVGHSVGAVTTLRLALRQPERFSALVLIDPVLFPPRRILTWDLIYRLGLGYRVHPMIKSAMRRRNEFESREAMFANYRKKAVFRRMDDSALHAYCDSLACPVPDGSLQLCYSPAWEARIYVTGLRADMELWRGLPTLKPPLLVIRGAETDTFWEETAARLQRRLPTARVETIPGASHLVPLEQPQPVYASITRFIQSLDFDKNSSLRQTP